MKTTQHDYYPARYKADRGAFALIDFKPDSSEFKSDMTAEVYNESYGGCKLLIPETEKLQIGDSCIAKIGYLKPMRATVVWRSHDDDGRLEIGLQYEE